MAPAWEITPTPSAVTDRPADQEVRFTYRVLSVWGHGTFDKSQFSLFRKHFGLFSPGNPQIPVNHRGYQEAARELKDAALQHKGYLDEVRDLLEGILKDLATELAITATIAIASSFITFGAGAAIGGAKAASTIARFARSIESVISRVKTFTRFSKFKGMLVRVRQRSLNSKTDDILRMQITAAKPGIRKNNLRGRLGERRAGLDPNAKKEQITIGGRKRFPDKIDHKAREVIEVKNVNKLSSRDIKQIKDSATYAEQNGYTLKLFVDNRTASLPPEIEKLRQSGKLDLVVMNLN